MPKPEPHLTLLVARYKATNRHIVKVLCSSFLAVGAFYAFVGGIVRFIVHTTVDTNCIKRFTEQTDRWTEQLYRTGDLNAPAPEPYGIMMQHCIENHNVTTLTDWLLVAWTISGLLTIIATTNIRLYNGYHNYMATRLGDVLDMLHPPTNKWYHRVYLTITIVSLASMIVIAAFGVFNITTYDEFLQLFGVAS